nr:serine/arginine repetitive matrix protein 2-like [Cherax quadricarinatus]
MVGLFSGFRGTRNIGNINFAYVKARPSTAVSPTSTDGESLRRYLKEQELEEFYSTYDVWTGIRTAVTLALFFIFTVTLILYKSKCKPRRKYEPYPSLEDMPGRPLDYCDYWCPSPLRCDSDSGIRTLSSLNLFFPSFHRLSHSSISRRVKSLPGSVMRINSSRNSSFEGDDASQVTGHSVRSEFLSVPGVRLQSTGSSSDGYSAGSSTHDLSGEMTAMALLGVPGLGPRGNKPVLQLGGMDWDSDHATAEWIQTIDINVIQPTPNISPCGSVRSVSDNTELSRLPLPGRVRVASVVSLDSPEFDNRSIGSDSVFMEDSMGDFSSLSESIDSGTPSLQASSRSMLTPSPRSSLRKVQSFRLGINPSASAASSASPVPTRVPTLADLHRPRDQRSRQKLLKRQQVQDIPVPSITRSGPALSSLLVPNLGGHLNASCERLAAHSAVLAESEMGSSFGSNSLTPAGSTEEEPMCAVYTVPSLRRCNSATTPGQKEEAAGWKRADSAQNPSVRRADSASGPQRQSSESSSGSDDASESVSFHLMVPALSIDNPSNDTSRASSPTLSPPSSPNTSPPPTVFPASPQHPRVSEGPVTDTLTPTSGLGRGLRGNGGRRVLRRQYSQCIPPSPALSREIPAPTSLPTYVEENDADEEFSFPAAPPPSPFRAGHSLFFRRDSGPPSPLVAAHHVNRQDSGPSPPLLSPHYLNRQDSGPSPPLLTPYYINRQDSGPSPPILSPHHLNRQDSGPSPPPPSPYYLNLQEPGVSPPVLSPNHLRRQDSGMSPSPNHFLRQEYRSSPSPNQFHRQEFGISPSPNHFHRQDFGISPSPNHFHRQEYGSSPSPNNFYHHEFGMSSSPSHIHRQDYGTSPSLILSIVKSSAFHHPLTTSTVRTTDRLLPLTTSTVRTTDLLHPLTISTVKTQELPRLLALLAAILTPKLPLLLTISATSKTQAHHHPAQKAVSTPNKIPAHHRPFVHLHMSFTMETPAHPRPLLPEVALFIVMIPVHFHPPSFTVVNQVRCQWNN